jgi:aminopeptidase 2
MLTIFQYEAVLSASKTATSIDKRDICLGALGHASQHALIRRTLEYAVSPDILAINETSRVLNGLTKHAAGKQALWKWLKNDMDNIKRKVFGGSGRFARLVQLCTMSLCTREQWEDVKGFFEGKDTEVSDDLLRESDLEFR